jgi:hypothetical protein
MKNLSASRGLAQLQEVLQRIRDVGCRLASHQAALVAAADAALGPFREQMRSLSRQLEGIALMFVPPAQSSAGGGDQPVISDLGGPQPEAAPISPRTLSTEATEAYQQAAAYALNDKTVLHRYRELLDRLLRFEKNEQARQDLWLSGGLTPQQVQALNAKRNTELKGIKEALHAAEEAANQAVLVAVELRGRPYPGRALWFRRWLAAHELTMHRFHTELCNIGRRRGRQRNSPKDNRVAAPDRKTLYKIWAGLPVRESVLIRLAQAMTLCFPDQPVTRAHIPDQ